MRKFLVAVGLVALVLPAAAWADPPKPATLVYDVLLREFTCWTEEPVKPATMTPCVGKEWHPLTSAFHLKRGQLVQILLMNAKALDLFVVEVTADDLAEPGLPAVGGLAELPKLQTLTPMSTLIPGVGAVLAGGSPVTLDDLHRNLVNADLKTFTAWLDDISGRFDAKEVRELLAKGSEVAEALTSIVTADPKGTWTTTANTLTEEANAIAASRDPASTADVLGRMRTLTNIIDRVAWLRSQIVSSPIPSATDRLAAAAKGATAVAVADALAIPQVFFSDLTVDTGPWVSGTNTTCWYPEVAALTAPAGQLIRSTGNICTANFSVFLGALTKAAGGTINAATLKQLKANLNLLGERRTRLLHAATVRAQLDTMSQNINTASAALVTLRTALANLTTAILTKASALNADADSVPLDPDRRLLPVGTWFSTKMVKVTIKQGRRAAVFDAPNTTAASTVSTDDTTQPAKGPLAAVADMGVVRTFQFPVYNMYRFQLGLGTAYSSANDTKYQVNTITTGSGSTQVVEKYIEETLSRRYNVLWTANLVFYPKARHAFPERPRFKKDPIGSKADDLGFMVGFSVLEPTKNILLGGVWMPRGGSAGLQIAYHLALRDVPQGDLSEPLSARLTTFKRKPYHGFSIGIVLSSDAFGKFLAPIFKP
jgi:hypothetical protein